MGYTLLYALLPKEKQSQNTLSFCKWLIYRLGNKVRSLTDPYDIVPCLFGPLTPPRLDLWRNLRALKPPLIPDMPIHSTQPPSPTLCPVNITQKNVKTLPNIKVNEKFAKEFTL